MYKDIKFANRIIYYVFLFVFLFYIVSGLIFSRVDTNVLLNNGERTPILPEKTIFADDNTIEYYIKLEAVGSDNMALIFVTRHQEVEVYSGNDLIYYLKAHKSVYGTTTGTNYTMVAIPENTTDVKVRLTNVYAGTKVRETTFEYGDETDMVKGIVCSSLPSAVLSAFIILVGAGMILLWLVCRRKFAKTQSLLYFGTFAMVIGLWTLNETDLATLFVNDRKIASLAGYILLMMIPVPFVQAEKNFFEIKKSGISNIMCLIFMVMDIVLLSCHVSGIMELKNSVLFIHMMLIMSFFYFCGVVVRRIMLKGFDRKVKSNIIAVIALGVSMVVDLFAYYRGMQQTDVLGNLGILIFIVLLGYESISEVFEQIKEGQKAEFYREMAITDSMTGLYNRAAFEEWEKSTTDYEGYAIVTFDLNNLKSCNDTIGHAAGDMYIKAAAAIIKDIFGRHGACYRIGGDEFCTVISQREKKFDIGRHIKQLREREKNENNENAISNLEIHIACGYAQYDSSVDRDFEATRSRADKRMYESKQQLKSN